LERIKMQEQRATPRVRSYLAGRVLFPNGISTMDCAVRDISSSGARLQVTSTAGLPGHFRLHIPQRERTYDVRVRWIAQQEIGVSFEVDSDTPVASEQDTSWDLKNRVVRLEAEVRQLRRLVQALSSGPQAAQRD
jgi:PilZ domain